MKQQLEESEAQEKEELRKMMLSKLSKLTSRKLSKGIVDYMGATVVAEGVKYNNTILEQLNYEEMCIRDR